MKLVCSFLLSLFALSSCIASSAKEEIAQIFSLADIQLNGTRAWDITVHNEGFYDRVLSGGSLALGESYMDGWWDSAALDDCMAHILQAHLDEEVTFTWDLFVAYCKASFSNLQDKMGSMKVIDQHYQLGNDLYSKMLDPLMMYSCGYWKSASQLEQAQEAKCDLICKKLGLQKGMRVLDIGCGWGGFSKYAAEHYGVEMVGITLSENQAKQAREVCKGLPVEIRVQDYRDLNESFDRILEIGMFEHVGVKNYPIFMQTVHRCLKPGGLFMLHTIGRNSSGNITDPWIEKYIFPNSVLPSISQIGSSVEGLFVMEDWHNFGCDYDKTLMAWFRNFDAHWSSLQQVYGPRFYRMWKYYLLSCAAAFRTRNIQLWQVVLAKEGVAGGYSRIQ
ncbi:MAG TPA: cyclopropane fatty acyl phospholipid synthase [Chlamydiales bacterium]|nr:cyclopropane fatty acyl phospholipid synthase [Chlamydiales bacterium]